MRIRALLTLLSLAALAGCSPTLSEDFDAFCKVANEVNREKRLSAEEKLVAISQRKGEFTRSSEGGSPAPWPKIDALPAAQRYAALLEAARSAGKADYKCTSYERIMATLAVEETAKQQAESPPDAGVSPDAGVAPAPAEDPKKAASKAEKKKTEKKKKKKKKKSH